MPNLRLQFFICLVCISIFSCSQLDRSNNDEQHLADAPLTPNKMSQIEDIKNRLELLVESALKSEDIHSKNYIASDLFLKASAAQVAGDYVSANLLYSYLVRLQDDDYIKTKYAVSLIRAGELDEAKQYLIGLYKKDSTNHKIALVLAGVHTGLNEVKSAQSIYETVLKQDPSHEDACVFLSKSYMVQEKAEQAIKVLSACEKKNSKSGVFSYYIGKIHLEKNKLKQAKSYFERSLVKQPSFARAVLALGVMEEEASAYDKAVKLYKKFLTTTPNEKTVLSRLVQTLFIQEKFNEVVSYAERLSDLEPDNLNLKVKLGILYSDAKNYTKAVSVFKELLNVAPSSDKLLYYLGAIYQETKQFEPAIEVFSKIEASSALYQDSTVQIAQMLSHMAQSGLVTSSDTTFEKKFFEFLEVKTDEMPGLTLEFAVIKSSYFEATSNLTAAIKELEAVKNHQKFSQKHAYYLAALYDQNKQFEISDEMILGMIKDNPENADALNFIAYSYIERDINMDQAYSYLKQALKLKPNDGYYRDSLGWYYYKTGKLHQAKKELDFALKQSPDDSTIAKHAGIVAKELKQYEQAKEYLMKALSLAKSHSDKKEIKKYIEQITDDRLPASENVVKTQSK